MSVGIEVVEELFGKVGEIVNAEFALHNIKPILMYHSNVIPEHHASECRVYINRRIFREEQDTISTNVTDSGRIRYESTGLLQVSFFVPRALKNSFKATEMVAQELKNQLRKSQFKCVWLRNIMATPYNSENNSYRYEVTATFIYDEIV